MVGRGELELCQNKAGSESILFACSLTTGITQGICSAKRQYKGSQGSFSWSAFYFREDFGVTGEEGHLVAECSQLGQCRLGDT